MAEQDLGLWTLVPRFMSPLFHSLPLGTLNKLLSPSLSLLTCKVGTTVEPPHGGIVRSLRQSTNMPGSGPRSHEGSPSSPSSSSSPGFQESQV